MRFLSVAECSDLHGSLSWGKRPTGVLLYIGKIHAILQVWNQSIRKSV